MNNSSIPKNENNDNNEDAAVLVPDDHSLASSQRPLSRKTADDSSFTEKPSAGRFSIESKSASSTSKQSRAAKKATGSIHLTKPTRQNSFSMTACGLSMNQSGHSGYDSDQTEVTSNTNPNSSLHNSNSSLLSTGFECGMSPGSATRWSSGDATKPTKRGSIDRKRRSSGSTAPTTSCGSTLVSQMKVFNLNDEQQKGDGEDPDTVQGEGDKDKEEDEDEASLVLAVAVRDLRSKPGFINIQELGTDHEEEFEFFDDSNNFEEDPGHQSLAYSTRASPTDSSGSGSSASLFLLTEERVRAHLKDYYEDFDSIFRLGESSEAVWDSFFKQYYTKDILWVDSCSSTLKGSELVHHFVNDIEGLCVQLVSIDNIQLLDTTAIVVFTADQEFLYRGHPPVSDRTVLTMVLHVDASLGPGQEKIRIAHEHRCVGKPIPNDTRWRS